MEVFPNGSFTLTLRDTKSSPESRGISPASGWSFLEPSIGCRPWLCASPQGGKTFAFSADTLACDEVVACAKNADLFLCDALCADLDGEKARRCAGALCMLTAREAATMATRAGAGALACTHIARFANPNNILAEASAHFSGAVTIARDGDRYRI